jgi:hypothetical protein
MGGSLWISKLLELTARGLLPSPRKFCKDSTIYGAFKTGQTISSYSSHSGRSLAGVGISPSTPDGRAIGAHVPKAVADETNCFSNPLHFCA